MAIHRYFTRSAGVELILCLSSDTKPAALDGTTLVEQDTAKVYRRVAGVWTEQINASYITSPEFADNVFVIYDNTTPSKEAVFDASGISASNVRTFAFPDVSGTIPTLENNHVVTGAWQLGDLPPVQETLIPVDLTASYSGFGPAITDGVFKGALQIIPAGLTADRCYAFPDGSGVLVIGGVSSFLVGASSSTLDTNTAASGTAFKDATTAAKKLRFILSGAASANSTITVTNSGARNYGLGNIAGNVVIVGDDPPGVAGGSLGKVDLTAQTANIGATNLSSTPPAGLYEVEAYLLTTTADAAAGTLAVNIAWTDGVGATNVNVIAGHVLTATGRTTGSALCQVASGDISYAVTVTGGYGTSAYAVYLRVKHLG